uniref:Uncharacterized protein n=1 Tax=Glossina austeni TaxID=7395 RepID=A0A1A9VA84_GLOAU
MAMVAGRYCKIIFKFLFYFIGVGVGKLKSKAMPLAGSVPSFHKNLLYQHHYHRYHYYHHHHHHHCFCHRISQLYSLVGNTSQCTHQRLLIEVYIMHSNDNDADYDDDDDDDDDDGGGPCIT